MKSNDKIPADELILAELIATAESLGLVGCKGSMFKTEYNQPVYEYSDTGADVEIVACCALGAAQLCKIKLGDYTALGNDAYTSDQLPQYVEESALRDWNIGAAFNLAMEKS